jgi:hypothetical protein
LSHHLEANLFYQNEKASSSAKKRTGGSVLRKLWCHQRDSIKSFTSRY